MKLTHGRSGFVTQDEMAYRGGCAFCGVTRQNMTRRTKTIRNVPEGATEDVFPHLSAQNTKYCNRHHREVSSRQVADRSVGEMVDGDAPLPPRASQQGGNAVAPGPRGGGYPRPGGNGVGRVTRGGALSGQLQSVQWTRKSGQMVAMPVDSWLDLELKAPCTGCKKAGHRQLVSEVEVKAGGGSKFTLQCLNLVERGNRIVRCLWRDVCELSTEKVNPRESVGRRRKIHEQRLRTVLGCVAAGMTHAGHTKMSSVPNDHKSGQVLAGWRSHVEHGDLTTRRSGRAVCSAGADQDDGLSLAERVSRHERAEAIINIDQLSKTQYAQLLAGTKMSMRDVMKAVDCDDVESRFMINRLNQRQNDPEGEKNRRAERAAKRQRRG